MNPQIPPIPSVAIADPQTGRVAREWWRWFHLVAQVAIEQQGTLDLGLLNLLPPDPPPDAAQSLFAGLLMSPRADDPVPAAQIALLAQTLSRPDDSANPDQIVLRALMASVPA